MLNTKYLNTNNKIKKKIINLFMPILVGRKNNRIVNKTFYYDNMYYKLFYLNFNHISLMNVFLKDKKIFYNFSKYFQINLYIYLIKTNLIILNLFFHFFYMLFLTFENFEDIYNNIILLKGYKRCLKRKTFIEAKNGWIKSDHGIEFYLKQRINSISLYVLNFNIYKNKNFYKYNLFLLHTKLIYKLFHYFKLLQYKVQSFVVLYKKHYKVEKQKRLFFAKSNCMIYKYLNIQLIKYFSFYKLYLKKNNLKINLNLINKKSTKKLINKPVYNNVMKYSYLKEKNYKNIKNLKLFNNINLAQHIFKLIFSVGFIPLYYNLFYNTIYKLKWLKEIFLKNKVYYKKIFFNFFMKFFNNYLLSTKLIKRFDLKSQSFTDFFYDMTQIKILSKFIHIFSKVINQFICNFFNLNSLPNKIKNNFINFVREKMKFNLLLKAISLSEFTKIIDFYTLVVNLFEQFLNKDFNIKKFYLNLLNIQKLKTFYLFAKQIPFYDSIFLTIQNDNLLKKIQYKIFKNICYKRNKKKLKELTFNKNQLNFKSSFLSFDEDQLLNYYDYIDHISMFLKKDKKKKLEKNKFLLKLSEFSKKKNDKKKKIYFLNLLSKKIKNKKIINKLKIKMKIRKLISSFLKKRYIKFMLNNNININNNNLNNLLINNVLFIHNNIKNKMIFLKKEQFKLKKNILNKKLKNKLKYIYILNKKLKKLKIKKQLKKKKIIKLKIKTKKTIKRKLKKNKSKFLLNFQKILFNRIKKKKNKLNRFFYYYSKNNKKKKQHFKYKKKIKLKKKRYYKNNKFKFRKNKVFRIKKSKKKLLRFLRKYKILYLNDIKKIMKKKKNKYNVNKVMFYKKKIKNKLFNSKFFKSFLAKKLFVNNLKLKKRIKTKYFKFPKKLKKPIFKNRFFKIYNKIRFKSKKRKEKKNIVKKKKFINKKFKLKQDLNLFKSSISKFQLLYLHSLKSKLKKLKKSNIKKIKSKLRKKNRKISLLKKSKNNYLIELVKINETLKFKYYKFLLIKSLILKLKANNNNLIDDNIKTKNLNKIIELKKKLKFFKINKLKNFLKNINKLIKKHTKSKLKFNKHLFIKKKTKINKLYTKKYWVLINRKFLKKKKFNINSRALKFDYIYFYSKKFYASKFGRKFKQYLKSPSFRKLINYKKHYKKYLEKKKRKRKKIKFKLNFYLKIKGLKQFLKLNKIQAKFKNLKNKIKKTKKIKKIIKIKKTKKTKKIEKLKLINLKIIKILKQNNSINLNIKKFKNDDNILNLINFRNNNKNKLKRLYVIKTNINKKLIKNKKKIKLLDKLLKKNKFINSKKLIKTKIFNLKKLIKKSKSKLIKIKKLNKKKIINYEKIKLKKLIIKLKKLKIKNLKLKLLYLKKLILIKSKKNEEKFNEKLQKELEERKLDKFKRKKFEVELKDKKITDIVVQKLQKRHDALNRSLDLEDLRQMERIKFLEKKEKDEALNVELDENATEFAYGTSFKELKRRHMRRVQGFYRRQFRVRQSAKKILPSIPRRKKSIFFFVKGMHYLFKFNFKRKKFHFNKYIFFFKILLRTRLELFKKKSNFRFFFLNKLKNLIKTILFRQKTRYYSLSSLATNIGINLHDEYKTWHLSYIKLKKIPFKLIRLYSKFYFNKLIYNLKLKSNFYNFYYKYLISFKKVNFSIKLKPFKKKRVKKLFQNLFYKLFKNYAKYFVASKKVLFSLMRNSRFYMRDKTHVTTYNAQNYRNSKIKIFLKSLRMRRSYYMSRYTRYSSFFFIYWAKKFYDYNVYENYRKNFDTSVRLQYYFKFFKSKTFFFNYLINFVFSYIQKLNINIFNYVFILNQYKTKLVIDVNQYYKYLILFFFKKQQYLNIYNMKNQFNFIMPQYFSFFSIFFKQLSIELSNWYSFVNLNLKGCQSTFLFNLCFISLNTNAVYLHYKYKYLYYYRVYNFYIFYIFYYLYNHLFKVYKKLKLKGFKLSYDLIKNNEYNRYYLGLRTRMLILTIRNKYKHGFTVEKIFRNIQFFLRESMKKKELAGYYISIRGRYKRSRRSNKLIIKKGVYSFNKIDLKIDSSYGTLNTKYGIAGIKVIFAFK